MPRHVMHPTPHAKYHDRSHHQPAPTDRASDRVTARPSVLFYRVGGGGGLQLTAVCLRSDEPAAAVGSRGERTRRAAVPDPIVAHPLAITARCGRRGAAAARCGADTRAGGLCDAATCAPEVPPMTGRRRRPGNRLCSIEPMAGFPFEVLKLI